jgi:hypothetical protein
MSKIDIRDTSNYQTWLFLYRARPTDKRPKVSIANYGVLYDCSKLALAIRRPTDADEGRTSPRTTSRRCALNLLKLGQR